MLSTMAAENPFCVVIIGDFNCRSSQWWENEIENNKGKLFEPLTSDLGLYQLISEPTHFMGDSKSCIDLYRNFKKIYKLKGHILLKSHASLQPNVEMAVLLKAHVVL